MHSDLLEGFYILSVSSFELLSYWDTREEGRGQLERAALHPDRPPTGLNDLDNVTGDAARDEIIEPLDSPYKPADDIRAGRVNIRLRQYVIRLKSDTRHQTSLRHGLHHSFELRSQSAPAQGALRTTPLGLFLRSLCGQAESAGSAYRRGCQLTAVQSVR